MVNKLEEHIQPGSYILLGRKILLIVHNPLGTAVQDHYSKTRTAPHEGEETRRLAMENARKAAEKATRLEMRTVHDPVRTDLFRYAYTNGWGNFSHPVAWVSVRSGGRQRLQNLRRHITN